MGTDQRIPGLSETAFVRWLTVDGEQLRLDDLGAGTIRLGPRAGPTSADLEIARLRAAGLGYGTIANALNRRGISTATGAGQWHWSSVRNRVERDAWAAYMRSYRARHR